jgi:hypothetical protein
LNIRGFKRTLALDPAPPRPPVRPLRAPSHELSEPAEERSPRSIFHAPVSTTPPLEPSGVTGWKEHSPRCKAGLARWCRGGSSPLGSLVRAEQTRPDPVRFARRANSKGYWGANAGWMDFRFFKGGAPSVTPRSYLSGISVPQCKSVRDPHQRRFRGRSSRRPLCTCRLPFRSRRPGFRI